MPHLCFKTGMMGVMQSGRSQLGHYPVLEDEFVAAVVEVGGGSNCLVAAQHNSGPDDGKSARICHRSLHFDIFLPIGQRRGKQKYVPAIPLFS